MAKGGEAEKGLAIRNGNQKWGGKCQFLSNRFGIGVNCTPSPGNAKTWYYNCRIGKDRADALLSLSRTIMADSCVLDLA